MSREAPDSFLIRDAGPDDVAGLAALSARVGSGGWSAADFRRALGDAARTTVLLGEPAAWPAEPPAAGYVVFHVVIDEMEILDLVVGESWRRRGLGATLLETALRRGRQQGARTTYLEVRESNAAARALYGRFSFQVHSRRVAYYRQPTEDAIVLRRANPPELLP